MLGNVYLLGMGFVNKVLLFISGCHLCISQAANMQYHKITDILGFLSTKLKGNENTVGQRCAQTSAGAGV